MATSTTTVSSTTEHKINTKPLSDAVQKAQGQIQTAISNVQSNIQKQASDKASDLNDKVATSGVGQTVTDIVSKANNTKEKDSLVAYIAANAKNQGFGAFSNKDTWVSVRQLGDIMVCEMIAKELEKNKLLKDGKISLDSLINLYLGKTFGNQSFMGEINGEITKDLDTYINNAYNSALYELDKNVTTQVGNVIQKVNAEANQVLGKANDIINKVTKTDISKSLDEVLRNSISLDGINRKLSSHPLGKILKPGLNRLFNKGIDNIIIKLTDTGVMGQIQGIQQQIIKNQEYINQAQQFLQNQEAVVQTYINEAKKQAEQIVTQYANQVIADISSKINIDLGGLGGSLF